MFYAIDVLQVMPVSYKRPPNQTPLQFRFVAAGYGRPEQTEAVVPLAPCSSTATRAIVQPSSPLPWPDYFVHTLEPFTAIVSRVHLANNTVSVTEADLVRIRDAVFDDATTFADALRARFTENPPSDSEDSHMEVEDDDLDHGMPSELEAGSHSSDDELERRQMRDHVELWFDVGAVKYLDQPDEFNCTFLKLAA